MQGVQPRYSREIAKRSRTKKGVIAVECALIPPAMRLPQNNGAADITYNIFGRLDGIQDIAMYDNYATGNLQVLDVERVAVNMVRLTVSNTEMCFPVIACSGLRFVCRDELQNEISDESEEAFKSLRNIICVIRERQGRARFEFNRLVSQIVALEVRRIPFDIGWNLQGVSVCPDADVPVMSYLLLTNIKIMSWVSEQGHFHAMVGNPIRQNLFVDWRHYSWRVLTQVKNLHPGSSIGITVPVRCVSDGADGVRLWELFDGVTSLTVMCPDEIQKQIGVLELNESNRKFILIHMIISKPHITVDDVYLQDQNKFDITCSTNMEGMGVKHFGFVKVSLLSDYVVFKAQPCLEAGTIEQDTLHSALAHVRLKTQPSLLRALLQVPGRRLAHLAFVLLRCHRRRSVERPGNQTSTDKAMFVKFPPEVLVKFVYCAGTANF